MIIIINFTTGTANNYPKSFKCLFILRKYPNAAEPNQWGGGCHAPARPYAPVSKPGLLDEGRVPRGVQGRAGA